MFQSIVHKTVKCSRLAKSSNALRLRAFASGPGHDDENQDKFNIKREHPIERSMRILKNDMKTIKNFFSPQHWLDKPAPIIDPTDFVGKKLDDERFQTHCDVLVIGGGGVGSSVAYWLKKAAREGLNVCVVEKDDTYCQSSTSLSVGGLRQQFSLEENILMSLYGADFLRNIKQHLGDDVDVNFVPHGYLMLASEEGAETLQKNSRLQIEMGARNELLNARQLKEKFPWLNTDGIALGCHGLEKEGWFDPWALLCAMKRKACQLGAHYVKGEVVGFDFKHHPDILMQGVESGQYQGLDKVIVKLPDGQMREIKFSLCVLAAGAQSGKVAKMAKIGTGDGLLHFALPVEPRKRFVYVFSTQGAQAPGLNTPLTIDPSGAYFRRDGLGGNYLGGRSPTAGQEPSCDNLDVDFGFFDQEVWPLLAKRVPAFEGVKVHNAWAGFYEYNTFDENGIIGTHPYYGNLVIATGFSGHGIQQTPAVGRAISELIIHGGFDTIDLSRLGFDRIIIDQPMYETNIV